MLHKCGVAGHGAGTGEGVGFRVVHQHGVSFKLAVQCHGEFRGVVVEGHVVTVHEHVVLALWIGCQGEVFGARQVPEVARQTVPNHACGVAGVFNHKVNLAFFVGQIALLLGADAFHDDVVYRTLQLIHESNDVAACFKGVVCCAGVDFKHWLQVFRTEVLPDAARFGLNRKIAGSHLVCCFPTFAAAHVEHHSRTETEGQ